VNDPAETITALDRNHTPRHGRCNRRPALFGWIELQRSVRPVTVVMICVHGDNSFEMLLIENQQPIKAF
jgi:hypothetical protein